MSVEFSGGVTKPAFIPLHSWLGDSFSAEPIFVWDPAAADTLSELMREHVAAGGDLREFLIRIMTHEIRELRAADMRRLLMLIRETPKKKIKLVCNQLAWASGLSLVEGETLGTLARAHGMSKQAFEQGANKYKHRFPLRTQTSRSAEAREKMSKRNHRKLIT